jgi:hypothetical protein
VAFLSLFNDELERKGFLRLAMCTNIWFSLQPVPLYLDITYYSLQPPLLPPRPEPKSFDILLQPLLKLLHAPRARNIIIDDPIKDYRRRNMDADEPIRLNLHLDIVRNAIPNIQTPVLRRPITDLQQRIHVLLAHAHAARYLAQSPIRRIPRLIHNIDVEELLLPPKQLLAELPELVRLHALHRIPGLVHQRRRRMPRLDLLAEYEDEVRRLEQLGLQGRVVERVEELGAEGAHVVEVWMWVSWLMMDGFRSGPPD